MNASRVTFLKHFQSGIKRGLALPAAISFPISDVAERLAELRADAEDRVVKREALTGAAFVITDVEVAA